MNNYLLSSLLLMSTVLFSSIDAQTECTETRGCEGQTISNRWVDCYGYFGCASATISSSEVYSWSYATYEANVASELMYAYGYNAGYSATIEATTIYSYGYHSTGYAKISPLGTDLVVYFYGYFAGNGADVSCDSGQTCTIHCKSNGCFNSNFYCYSGAACNVVCTEDAENCPTQIGEGGDESSELTLTDVQIKAIYDRNVAENRAEKEGNTFGMRSKMPMMDVFEHPNFDGGIALDEHSNKEGTISFGMAALIAVLSAVVGAVVGMTALYYCVVKREGYFKI